MPLPQALLAQLRAFPADVRQAGSEVAPDAWTRRPSPREFAMVEHACHLRDFEIEGCHARLRRMLAEVEPELVDFDGVAEAQARNYLAQDGAAALKDFARARGTTVDRLAALTDAELARTARFGEAGVITLARLAEMLAEHDASHREELGRLVVDLRR